jgi:hypothetical protein
LLPCAIALLYRWQGGIIFLASYADLFEVPRSETENLFRMSPAGRFCTLVPKA